MHEDGNPSNGAQAPNNRRSDSVSHILLHTAPLQIDLADVPQQYALPAFNLLSQGRNVEVKKPHKSDKIEIPPMINLAIGLSITACRMRRGLFLWTQKPAPKKDGSQIAAWCRLPDLLFLDYRWTEHHAKAFLNSDFNRLRDNTCAALMLHHDIVMPFLVDFCGIAVDDPYDARVTAEIDSVNEQIGAISIPGAAYVGWVRDMIPDLTDHASVQRCFRKANPTQRDKNEFILSDHQRSVTQVSTQKQMYERILQMYQERRKGSITWYAGIMRMLRDVGEIRQGND